jgi:signal transduction histidine kinase
MTKQKSSEQTEQIPELTGELVKKAPIGIFVIESSGNVIMSNPVLKNIFNPIGNKNPEPGAALFAYITNNSKLKELLEKAVADRRPARIDQLKYPQRLNREEKILNIWIVPVFDDGQKTLKHYIFYVEDMTQFALLDNKIQRSEKLSAMGVMASGIAEEIKWPLSHILINLDFVERNTSEDSPMRSYLQAIKDDLDRIKFVGKQIRALSLPQNEDGKEVYEINQLLKSQPIKAKLNVLKEYSIEIKISVPEKPLLVMANENHLIQAMTHIIQNAAEAMQDGGILTISIEGIKENKHDIIVITITDTGIGITAENLSNIFKPFFSTKGKSATGLGLMVAYSNIDSLGGAIGIKSTPGIGTSVRIVLPALIE